MFDQNIISENVAIYNNLCIFIYQSKDLKGHARI